MRCLAWMADQIDTDLFIASLTVAEIHRGILEGKKREQHHVILLVESSAPMA